MNGNIKAGADFVNMGHLDDPTPHNGGHFGTSVAGLGNVVGDPLNEVLVGAVHLFAGHQEAISDVHVFEPLRGRVALTIDDPDQSEGSSFGANLAPMGDLNDDGAIDFVVGAPGFDAAGGVDEGRIYIFRSVRNVNRSVTLKLRRHLIATGDVSTASGSHSDAACTVRVRVVIKRNGKRVKTITTADDGRYRTRLPDRTGRYRAVARRLARDDLLCEGAASRILRHRHN